MSTTAFPGSQFSASRRPHHLGCENALQKGRIFLVDSFLENEPLADSINHLMN
jgi:hypothetical protein